MQNSLNSLFATNWLETIACQARRSSPITTGMKCTKYKLQSSNDMYIPSETLLHSFGSTTPNTRLHVRMKVFEDRLLVIYFYGHCIDLIITKILSYP